MQRNKISRLSVLYLSFPFPRLCQVIAKYDVNGDGKFSIPEVRAIVEDVQEEKARSKSLTRALVAVSVAALVFCLVMVGLMLQTNEMSKENHTKGGEMQDLNGNSVKTAQVSSAGTLLSFPGLEFDTLKEVKDISFVLGDAGADSVFMKVAGFRSVSDTEMYVYSYIKGTHVHIAGGAASYVVDGASPVTIDTSSRRQRRLSEATGHAPKVYSQDVYRALEECGHEDFEACDRTTRKARRLRRAAALSSAGSFQVSAAANRAGND